MAQQALFEYVQHLYKNFGNRFQGRRVYRAHGANELLRLMAQRVLGTVMGDTSLNHTSNSQYRNPTFYYIGTLDPLGSMSSTSRGLAEIWESIGKAAQLAV